MKILMEEEAADRAKDLAGPPLGGPIGKPKPPSNKSSQVSDGQEWHIPIVLVANKSDERAAVKRGEIKKVSVL